MLSVPPSITSPKRTGSASSSARPRGMSSCPVSRAMSWFSAQPESAATSSGSGAPGSRPCSARYTLSPNLAQCAVLAMSTGFSPRRFSAVW